MKGMERYLVAIGLLVVLFATLPASAQITITNATELQNMNLDLAGNYVLGNDIDASSISNFDPIGDFTTPFTGAFDGQGYTITGLTINRPGEDYVGLFGYAYGAIIQNVHLVATNVVGNNYVGSIVGDTDVGNVTNCSNAGSVAGNYNVGGIVGTSDNISDCHNTSHVSGNDSVGGVAGGCSATGCSNSGDVTGNIFFTGGIAGVSGNISDCYNTGTISGPDYTGGIVGNHNNPVSNCYNTGAVSGTDNIGGIAGNTASGSITYCYNSGTISGTTDTGGLVGSIVSGYVEDCYSTGFVAGSGVSIGGLVGDAGVVTKSYWNTETSGQATSAGGEGKTTAEMMQQTTYFFWDFSTVWGMPCDGSSYPYLLIFPPDPIMNPVNVTINQSASQADPTDIALITFDVVFDVPVTDFDNGDLDFTGSTALIADATVANTGDNMHYTVEVTPSTEGTVIPLIPAGVLDLCSVATNTVSTSTDNTVEYMTELPTVPLAVWPLAVLLLAAGVGICQRRKKTH